jgi:flagellar basal-body rod modification protein FlgD
MTAIDPFTSVRTTQQTQAQNQRPATNPNDQMGQDTFLKLLVAQLKYQNPLSPTDGTEFLTQTAQFTMVEKLNQIAEGQASMRTANQVLAASSMVGKSVTYALEGNQAPTATTVVNVGGNLPANATVGTRVKTTASVYTTAGKQVPLQLEFTRTATGWDVRASSGSTPIGGVTSITFDAVGERTSGDTSLAAASLDGIAGTIGTWPAAGITLQFGAPSDSSRLHVGDGIASVSVREQNGDDGLTRTGIVTGIRIDADGALVQIDGDDVPVSSVTKVSSTG